MSSHKNKSVQFESGLEENFLYILTFDSEVKTFYSQPVEISYADAQGKIRKYIPDYLVEFRNRPMALIEVKSRKELKKNFSKLKPKIDAGRDYASKKSWTFDVITDKQIKTDYCQNVRFLFQFQTHQLDIEIANEIVNVLNRTRRIGIEELLSSTALDAEARSKYLAAIWTLIFRKRVSCNLKKPLSMHTKIWLSERGHFELKYPYTI
jgi:hypothetical protein